jgi:ferredoxin
MMRIEHDTTKCASLGMCEEADPEVFHIGEDGYLYINETLVTADRRASIELAVAACPTGALTLLDD